MLKNFCLGKMIHGRLGGMVNVFYKKTYTFPPKSFVENIGMDNSGIHSINTNNYKSKLIKNYKKPKTDYY